MNRHLKDYPFSCNICSMTFQKHESLTTHYRLHTGEKPYICEICEKTFTSEKNKRVHVLRHQVKRAESSFGNIELLKLI